MFIINYFIFSYIQYSNVAARVVRQALKNDLKADAGKRDITGIKFQKWEAGKPVGKYFKLYFIIKASIKRVYFV